MLYRSPNETLFAGIIVFFLSIYLVSFFKKNKTKTNNILGLIFFSWSVLGLIMIVESLINLRYIFFANKEKVISLLDTVTLALGIIIILEFVYLFKNSNEKVKGIMKKGGIKILITIIIMAIAIFFIKYFL